MKPSRRMQLALVGGVAALMLGIAVWALAQMGPGGWAPPGGGPPGGMGMGMGMGPMGVFGQVNAIDANTGAICVQDAQGQQTWVMVAADASITKTSETDASALKVGEQVVVSGQPTAITAGDIRLGQGQGGFGFGGFGAMGGPGGPGGPPGAGAAGAPPGAPPGGAAPAGPGGQRSFRPQATVMGTIASLEPLTVSLPDGSQATVTMGPEARVISTSQVTAADIVVGDQIMAMGQPGQDGYYHARMVRIGEMGGFGGFGGGFGAPGGGAGGFGGGRRGGGGGGGGFGGGGGGQ